MGERVSIVDYRAGNLGSIINMLRHLDISWEVVDTTSGVRDSERLLIPGVGSFDHGMGALEASGMRESLVDRISAGVPVLGICLGMQLLTDGSAEGVLPGLGALTGRCERVEPGDPRKRVPHMGWQFVTPSKEHALVDSFPAPSKFYFAHSYHVVCSHPEDVLARSEYGVEFTSMVARDNVAGAQFHPEKSHAFGMKLLQNFSRWQP